MKCRAWRVWAVGIAVVALAAGPVLGLTLSFAGGDRICKGVVVSGVDVGGLTREVARGKLQAWAQHRAEQGVVLTALDCRWQGTAASLGARVEWPEAVDRAFAVGRAGNVFHRAVCVLTSGGNGKQFEARIPLDPTQLSKTLAKVAKTVNRPHADARIKAVDGHLEIEQDECGIKLNQARAAATITEALVSGQSPVSLPVEVDQPRITASEASGIDTLLGRFVTYFNRGKRDRTHNLKLAAGVLNGVILKTGEKFSYNVVVGPRVGERGYRSAPIFVRGKLEPGLGGGICQVSSTLYNAVLFAGLKVSERHPHSRTVPYVKAGRDATVAYGSRDFKFENSNSAPVCLITNVSGSKLTVDIYGAASDKRNIKIVRGKATYTAHGEETIVDDSLKPGETDVIDKGSSGVTVTVYRKITADDGSVTTDVVSRDRYPARPKIIAVAPAEQQAPQPDVPEAGASEPTAIAVETHVN